MVMAYRSVTSGADESPAESAGASEFDILLALCNCEDDGAATVNPATSYAQVDNLFNEGTGTGQQLMGGVYWIRRGSGAVANNWDITGSVGGARIVSLICYSGAKRTGNPWNGTPVLTLGSDSSAEFGSLTTDVDGCMIVGLMTVFAWNGGVAPTGGWNERLDQAGTGPMAIFDQLQAVAGVSPALTVTGDDSWIAMLLALEPHIDEVVPEQVTGLVGGVADTAIDLSWAVPYANPLASDHDVDWATAAAPTTWLGPVATGSGDASYRKTGLTNGTAYVFRVRAVNTIGDGAWSATSAEYTPAAPDGPSNNVLAPLVAAPMGRM